MKYIPKEIISSAIELYDIEKYIFNVIRPKAKRRGYLTFDEFYDICMWKSARPKQLYRKNNKVKVKKITKEAFAKEDEKEKIKTLCGLKGVGIPTASAILTAIFHKKYAVIDVRCLAMLKGTFKEKISKSITPKTWLTYLELMKKLADKYGVTPRKMDMALFAMHREKLKKDNRNLY